MAEEKLDEVEQPLASKRKLSSDVDSLSESTKVQKVNHHPSDQNGAATDNLIPPELEPEPKAEEVEVEDEDEDEEIDEEDYEDEDEDEDEEEDGGVVDRKGKGIMIEDVKGKGKMIEESESDDDDDDDDDDDGDDVEESDLDEDPLAEVDLDNILPSRTRQRGRAPQRSGIRLSDSPNRLK